MSLQKKIILSFLISAFIIGILTASAYFSFIEIRKEIRFLELSDTLRSKTLQLRRHEKNYFLYGDAKEVEIVYEYIRDIRAVLKQNLHGDKSGNIVNLLNKINEYSETFTSIRRNASDFSEEIVRLKADYKDRSIFFPVIETTFLERPLVNAELLQNLFSLKSTDPAIINLRRLNLEISGIRKAGEEILTISKNLDSSAREKVDKTISISQTAILVLFPLFFTVGLSALFVVGRSAVQQLKVLTKAIEKTGMGVFSSLPAPDIHDEVGMLIEAFNKMEVDLIERDRELEKKNNEILQSRKLASIGTLASGVAHELNNPLSNIYLSAQVLLKEIDTLEAYSPVVKEIVGDIYSQTTRMKRIVSDLLEFSRERAPAFTDIDIINLLQEIVNQMRAAGEMQEVICSINATEDVHIIADRHLMEQVFINLFSNSVQAMNGKGRITVNVKTAGELVEINISDTGKGIPPDKLQRVFDPFYTTKEKGTGLGLAIVYNIMEKHSGKIVCESALGVGTTFTITIPREQ